jgi:hypothetical protein
MLAVSCWERDPSEVLKRVALVTDMKGEASQLEQKSLRTEAEEKRALKTVTR